MLGKIEYLQGESAKWRTAFGIIKAPYSVLRGLGFSPQMAGLLLFGSSVAGGGVIAAEIVESRSFQRGDPGVYSAPLDVPVQYSRDNNTLRIDLGTTPVGAITIEDVTVGTAYTGSTLPTGETDAIVIGGRPETTTPSFTETFLEVGYLTIDRWRCDELNLTNIEAYQLNIKYNASDGQSIAPVAGTPRNRGVGGGNRADSMITSGGTYDQVRIEAPTSGVNGKVDVLTLSNINSSGGACTLDRIKVGTLDILFNEIAGDSDFATKEFTLDSTVVYKNLSNVDNVEVSGL